jgi:hypothetical protein
LANSITSLIFKHLTLARYFSAWTLLLQTLSQSRAQSRR